MLQRPIRHMRKQIPGRLLCNSKTVIPLFTFQKLKWVTRPALESMNPPPGVFWHQTRANLVLHRLPVGVEPAIIHLIWCSSSQKHHSKLVIRILVKGFFHWRPPALQCSATFSKNNQFQMDWRYHCVSLTTAHMVISPVLISGPLAVQIWPCRHECFLKCFVWCPRLGAFSTDFLLQCT